MTADTFGSFLNDMGREPLLTPSEELELARLIKQGEGEDATPLQIRRANRAKARMVAGNIRLAVNVAKKYTMRCKHLQLDDLVQEAMFGIHRAAEKFDPERGYKFSTYAYGWIRQSILRAIVNQETDIRVPVHVADQGYRFRKAQDEARMAGKNLTPQELADASDCSLEQLQMRVRAKSVVSLNSILGNEDGDTELQDMLAADPPDPGLIEEFGVDAEMLRNALNDLPEGYIGIISNYYGLGGKDCETLASMGKRLRLSRETIRKRRETGMRILKNRLCESLEVCG